MKTWLNSSRIWRKSRFWSSSTMYDRASVWHIGFLGSFRSGWTKGEFLTEHGNANWWCSVEHFSSLECLKEVVFIPESCKASCVQRALPPNPCLHLSVWLGEVWRIERLVAAMWHVHAIKVRASQRGGIQTI